MKVGAVSGDFVVKLALVAGLGVGAWFLFQRVRDALPAVNPQWVNPMSDQNIAYQAANTAISAAVGREETLGGWFHDLTHADPMAPTVPPSASGTGYDIPGLGPYFGA